MPATIGRDRLMSTAEAAAHLEIGEQHVRDLCRRGRLKRINTLFGPGITVESVTAYEQSRGPWAPGGCVGGRPAQIRLGINHSKR